MGNSEWHVSAWDVENKQQMCVYPYTSHLHHPT